MGVRQVHGVHGRTDTRRNDGKNVRMATLMIGDLGKEIKGS